MMDFHMGSGDYDHNCELDLWLGWVHGPQKQLEPRASAWLQGVAQTIDIGMVLSGNTGHGSHTDSSCSWPMDPDRDLSGTMGQDITMASGGSIGHSHQSVP